MRTSFMKKAAGSFMSAALGFVLLGGNAYADDAIARHMAQGKDYDAARSAARLETAGPTAPRTASQKQHARQMARGKDHWMVVAADSLAARGFDQQAIVARHAREMNQGKDHYAAWDAVRWSL